MTEPQIRPEAVAQHQQLVVSLLQDNGLSTEYNEKNGVYDQDSYRMALFKVGCDASSAATCSSTVAPDHANRQVQRCLLFLS
jgi:hypothetical protein